jgi:hypothetical protein
MLCLLSLPRGPTGSHHRSPCLVVSLFISVSSVATKRVSVSGQRFDACKRVHCRELCFNNPLSSKQIILSQPFVYLKQGTRLSFHQPGIIRLVQPKQLCPFFPPKDCVLTRNLTHLQRQRSFPYESCYLQSFTIGIILIVSDFKPLQNHIKITEFPEFIALTPHVPNASKSYVRDSLTSTNLNYHQISEAICGNRDMNEVHR